eukprot:15820900-Heterocapsa_arctica.AAC.1
MEVYCDHPKRNIGSGLHWSRIKRDLGLQLSCSDSLDWNSWRRVEKKSFAAGYTLCGANISSMEQCILSGH